MENNLVSVVLPSRNGMPFLRESIESILVQSYRDFELIVINDGSTDDTAHYLESISDKRLKVLNTEGIGLVSALNLAVGIARGRFICRMDADDVSMPHRIERQVSLLAANPEIGVVCSDVLRISEDGHSLGVESGSLQSSTSLRDGLLYRRRMKPIVHPTVLVRKSVLEMVGGYRHFDSCEDKDLWLRLVDNTKFVRIKEVLLKYRITKEGISRKHRVKQASNSLAASINYLVNTRIGVDVFENDKDCFATLLTACDKFASQEQEADVVFDKVRSRLRARQFFRLAIELPTAFSKIGVLLAPSVRIRRQRNFVDMWSDKITRSQAHGPLVSQ